MKEVDFSKYLVAYFSMEIGIDPEVRTFSGGLGVLAGDTLRSAADLDLPVIGITLLYKKGYFTQKIVDGQQQEEDAQWDPHQKLQVLPHRVTVTVEGREVQIQAWVYEIAGVRGTTNPIIFLDADLEENHPDDRNLTFHLYGGDPRYRLAQEIILGIGGTRMLETLGCSALRKYHMNEGHSALLTLELCKRFHSFEEVRERCVFTTHTPVPAGHDSFDEDFSRRMLGSIANEQYCAPIFDNGKLNMTKIALKFSKFINGVAKRHGEISREMFPGYHIASITNGVHAAFWCAPVMKILLDQYIPNWEADPSSLRYALSIPKNEIWDAHQAAKSALIARVNEKYGTNLDAEIFTIGFARRSTAYKRGDLIFFDKERLVNIAKRSKGVQFIFAGKAHPNDTNGKEIIKKLNETFAEIQPDVKAIYLENYDIELAKVLIPGVDIWLNTPMRPKEASGTSGMKAAVNGVPHFSILDGWWLEGHIEDATGWSIGAHPGKQVECDSCEDAEDLYQKLEQIILPRFYDDRDKWIDTMRHCIAINGSFFNTHRMMQQYVLNAYFT